MEQATAWLTLYGFRIFGTAVILVAGFWATKLITRIIRRIMSARNVEPTLVSFSGNLIHAALIAFVAIAAMSNLGIQTASLIAVLGAAGLAVGLALQGSLANFAAGVMILVFRPFKVGDYIEGGGVSGTVEDLQIFTTRLTTPDNKAIFVPNGKLSNDNITNFTRQPTRRMDLVVGVSYSADIPKVKAVLKEIIEADPRILKDPAPVIGILALADSSVNLAVRPWVDRTDYWATYFDLWEKIKLRFDAEGIGFPFPQRDVHLYQATPSKEDAA